MLCVCCLLYNVIAKRAVLRTCFKTQKLQVSLSLSRNYNDAERLVGIRRKAMSTLAELSMAYLYEFLHLMLAQIVRFQVQLRGSFREGEWLPVLPCSGKLKSLLDYVAGALVLLRPGSESRGSGAPFGALPCGEGGHIRPAETRSKRAVPCDSCDLMTHGLADARCTPNRPDQLLGIP